LIITGPNTGGKTVTLKTIGLLAIMAQSGLHIPALSGSKISVFDDIFADIGDEQSIEQSLSTFSGHITNIIQILKKADSYSLVLLDELGAGTDPQEGAALAMAIVKHLIDLQVTCMVATHYPELKAFAHNTRHVINASLEFDLQTLKPTYHLLLGLPGRSNALSIAEKLGLPESIIKLARGTIHPDELRSEDLLDEIYRQRSAAREAREAAELAQKQALAFEKEWRAKAEKIELEREKYLDSARTKAEDELFELKREIEEIRKELARLKMPLDEVKGLQQKAKDVEVIAESIADSKARIMPVQKTAIKKGTKVIVGNLGMQGIVEEISGEEAEVLVGRLHLRAKISELRRTGEVEPEKPIPAPPAKKSSAPAPARTVMMELDLRGERAEDALDRVDRYLDEAYSNGMPFVRIIHGKGTGRLRQVIRDALKASPVVKRFETGMESEGGDGVTVVHLSTD
jgi:DNA mismatch repair protein MutS2